jgi:hypothetical protein
MVVSQLFVKPTHRRKLCIGTEVGWDYGRHVWFDDILSGRAQIDSSG